MSAGSTSAWGSIPPRSSAASWWASIVLFWAFAAVHGLPVEGMTQDDGEAFFSTEVGQPVPGEETLDGDDAILPIRGKRLE
jgi:hypothetical protein